MPKRRPWDERDEFDRNGNVIRDRFGPPDNFRGPPHSAGRDRPRGPPPPDYDRDRERGPPPGFRDRYRVLRFYLV